MRHWRRSTWKSESFSNFMIQFLSRKQQIKSVNDNKRAKTEISRASSVVLFSSQLTISKTRNWKWEKRNFIKCSISQTLCYVWRRERICPQCCCEKGGSWEDEGERREWRNSISQNLCVLCQQFIVCLHFHIFRHFRLLERYSSVFGERQRMMGGENLGKFIMSW